jgi:hypothetical protein
VETNNGTTNFHVIRLKGSLVDKVKHVFSDSVRRFRLGIGKIMSEEVQGLERLLSPDQNRLVGGLFNTAFNYPKSEPDMSEQRETTGLSLLDEDASSKASRYPLEPTSASSVLYISPDNKRRTVSSESEYAGFQEHQGVASLDRFLKGIFSIIFVVKIHEKKAYNPAATIIHLYTQYHIRYPL